MASYLQGNSMSARSNWMSERATEAFSTHAKGMHEQHAVRDVDETSEEPETDSDEGRGVYQDREKAIKRRSKHELIQALIQILKNKLELSVELADGGWGSTKNWVEWFRDNMPKLMLIAAIAFTVLGIFGFDTPEGYEDGQVTSSGCRRSYQILAIVMTAFQSQSLVEEMRDAYFVSRGHSGSQVVIPEAHFLGGALPGKVSIVRVVSFAGFALGFLGILFGAFLMGGLHPHETFYMLLCSLFLLTSMLSFNLDRRDTFDASVWKDEILGHERGLLTQRVMDALQNIYIGQTRAAYIMRGANLLSMIFCIGIIVLVLIENYFETEHSGAVLALMCGVLGATWCLGQAMNPSVADTFINKKSTSWVIKLGPVFFVVMVTLTVAMVLFAMNFSDLSAASAAATILTTTTQAPPAVPPPSPTAAPVAPTFPPVSPVTTPVPPPVPLPPALPQVQTRRLSSACDSIADEPTCSQTGGCMYDVNNLNDYGDVQPSCVADACYFDWGPVGFSISAIQPARWCTYEGRADMRYDLQKKFTLIIALFTLIDACLNFTKAATKKANIKLLYKELAKRMGLDEGAIKGGPDAEEYYESLMNTGHAPNHMGSTEHMVDDPGYGAHPGYGGPYGGGY